MAPKTSSAYRRALDLASTLFLSSSTSTAHHFLSVYLRHAVSHISTFEVNVRVVENRKVRISRMSMPLMALYHTVYGREPSALPHMDRSAEVDIHVEAGAAYVKNGKGSTKV